VSGFGLTDQINVTVYQDNNFSLTVSGTDTGNGIVASLNIPPNGSASGSLTTSNVIGGTYSGDGFFTAPQFPNSTFFVTAKIASNDEGALIITSWGPGGEAETGTLVKR
jgi:hypothetical protein